MKIKAGLRKSIAVDLAESSGKFSQIEFHPAEGDFGEIFVGFKKKPMVRGRVILC